MNTSEYVEYYTTLLNVAGVEMASPSSHVKKAVRSGLEDFWGAGDWQFKMFEYSLSLTSGAEVYSLPNDFAGFRSFREEGTVEGLKLKYFPYEEFHEVVPKLSQYATGKPQAFTVFRDADDSDKWKIKFFPAPETITLYCGLVKSTGKDCDEVPDHLQGCLESFIAKHVYPHGTHQRSMALQESVVELKRCEVIDNPDKSSIGTMGDTTDIQMETRRPWV